MTGGRNLVFIVGSPRSGTTWLQRLLASHPKLHTGQESFLFFTYLGPLLRRWENQLGWAETSGRGPLGLPCYVTSEQFREALTTFADDLLNHILKQVGPGELFVEKTPDHALFIKEINTLFPESKIIHLLRDGRDVTASLFAASKTWGKHWAPKTPQGCAFRWAKYVRAVRSASKDLDRNQFLEVRYEILKEQPESTLAEIAHFLDIAWSPSEIREAIENNSIENMQAGKATPILVRGEAAQGKKEAVVEEPEGFVRKKRSKSWKQDISIYGRIRAWRIARQVMQATGYPYQLRDWI